MEPWLHRIAPRLDPRPAAPAVRRQVVDHSITATRWSSGARLALWRSCVEAAGIGMTMSEAQQQALERILARASEDLEFRSQLLSDPYQTIFDAFGIRIPAGFRVKFIEKGPDVDALIVLPDFRRPDGELGDRDLETVAGGVGGSDPDTW